MNTKRKALQAEAQSKGRCEATTEGMGAGHGLGLGGGGLGLAGWGGFSSQVAPINIWTETLASHASKALDKWAHFGRGALVTVDPIPYTRLRYRARGQGGQLVSKCGLASSDLHSLSQCINRCFVLHVPSLTLVDSTINPCFQHLF